MNPAALVFIPTYNEAENSKNLYNKIRGLGMQNDILFLDDNSPDGTGRVLDAIAAADKRVFVIHRPGKSGIGSAHLEGINWSYDHGYRLLVTMDCDFTHPPEKISDFLAACSSSADTDIVVGSRYLAEQGIVEWTWWRRLLTKTAHFLTVSLLKMPYDATGAFRLYRLDHVPRAAFGLVRSRSYSFFFESLYLLHINRFRIMEIPIALPKRACGKSKMSYPDILKNIMFLLRFTMRSWFARSHMLLGGR